MSLPDRALVSAAADRLSPHLRRTPILRIAAGELGPFPVVLKLEHLQHTGSFKVRGALNTILAADPQPQRVVAASGGNHGLGVAFAARQVGIPVDIFVPTLTPAVKVEALKRLGATVHQGGAVYADALAASQAFLAQQGGLSIHAYDEPQVCAGQGSLYKELLEDAPEVTRIVLSVGGSGLLAGALAWTEGTPPVSAVEPETSKALHDALAAGQPVDVDVSGIAADSLGARRAGQIGFSLARKFGVTSVLVTDDQIRQAQTWAWRNLHLILEPGAGAALAALTSGQIQADGPGAVILCGANTDPAGIAI